MLQDPNVERYVANAVKPLKKEIKQMKAQIEALNQALRIHDVVGQSEQLVCPHQATRTPNEEKTGKCRQCGRKIKAN